MSYQDMSRSAYVKNNTLTNDRLVCCWCFTPLQHLMSYQDMLISTYVKNNTLTNDRLVGCWSFTSLQHLRSYQGRYRIVTVIHSWWLFSIALLGNQATSTLSQCPTQWHYPDTELVCPCPMRIMPSAMMGSDKYKFLQIIGLTQLWFELPFFHTGSLHYTKSATASGFKGTCYSWRTWYQNL